MWREDWVDFIVLALWFTYGDATILTAMIVWDSPTKKTSRNQFGLKNQNIIYTMLEWLRFYIRIFYLYIFNVLMYFTIYIMITKHTASGNCSDTMVSVSVCVCGVYVKLPDETMNRKSFRRHLISSIQRLTLKFRSKSLTSIHKQNYQSLWLFLWFGNHYRFFKCFNFNNFQINFLSFEQSFCISLLVGWFFFLPATLSLFSALH